MTAKNSTLTVERLREVLDYDPESGVFTWRKNLKGGVRSGDVAGCGSKHGRTIVYKKIRVDGVLYYAHRLAFLHTYGRWPISQIDHAKDRSDAISNLRECDPQDNVRNTRIRHDNTSGFKGVTQRSGRRWIAQIQDGGSNKYLGIFDSPEKAAAAYDEAAKDRGGEFALTNRMLGLIS